MSQYIDKIKLSVIIASHLSLYRYYTIQECITSISDCIEYFKYKQNINKILDNKNKKNINNILYNKIDVYISYSYDNNLISMLDELDKILQSQNNINVIIYRHHNKKYQFEHIKYILDNNNFDNDDWIMFQDDDDISIENRISEFIRYTKILNFDVFRSMILTFNRNEKLLYPYGSINSILKLKLLINKNSDFATTITKIKIIKEFFTKNIIYNLYTDVHFTFFIKSKNVFTINSYLYLVRCRGYITDEDAIEILKIKN